MYHQAGFHEGGQLVRPEGTSGRELLGESSGDQPRGLRRVHSRQVLLHRREERHKHLLDRVLGVAQRVNRDCRRDGVRLQAAVLQQRAQCHVNRNRQPGVHQHAVRAGRVGGAEGEDRDAKVVGHRHVRHGLRGHSQGHREGETGSTVRGEDGEQGRHRSREDRVSQRSIGDEVSRSRESCCRDFKFRKSSSTKRRSSACV